MDAADIEAAVRRAFSILEREQQTPLDLEDGVVEAIALGCGGDVRKSINAVEMCVLSAPVQDGRRSIGMDAVRQVSQRSAMRYDRDGDAHYDILSAFHKSVRGSDENAALHYLARLLVAGDLLSPAGGFCASPAKISAWLAPGHPYCESLRGQRFAAGAAGSAASFGRRYHPFMHRAQIQRRGAGHRRGYGRCEKWHEPATSPPISRTATIPAPKNWGGALPTSTRTLTRGTTIRSSTCRTKSETGYTTSFRTTKRNRRRQPIADKFWGFGKKKGKVTAKVAWAGGIFMFGIRQIDKMHQQDILLENEPFPLWGRMIPSYEKEKWSYSIVKFGRQDTGEMCFPNENYDFEQYEQEQYFHRGI